MTGELHIDYEALAQDAMRAIVRTVLTRVAKTGLPGEHHFYIAFSTLAPGVALSKRLKEKYPEEMTIVLQHRFRDLTVTPERFEVMLTFDGIPERLVVPFSAIKVFFDPSVPYGLQLEGSDLAAGEATQEPDAAPRAVLPSTRRTDVAAEGSAAIPARLDKKPRATRKPRPEKGENAPADAPPSAPQGAAKRPPLRPQLVASQADKPPPAAANDTKVVHLDKFRKK